MPDQNKGKQERQGREQTSGAERSQSGNESRSRSGRHGGGDGKVNLNRADREELMRLEGVGQDLAEKIIEYRERKGGFKNVEEITYVEGFDETRARKVQGQARI